MALGIAAIASVASIPFINWQNKKEIQKVGMADIIGNTPLVYLSRLSKASGSDIYVMM